MSRQSASGFTLVELLVAVTVTTIVMLVITSFMLQNLQQNAFASNRATILSETENSLDAVANDVRLSANADQNNRWADPNGPSGNQYGWQSNSSTLVLATAAQDKNSNIIFSDAKDYITEKNNLIYFVQGGTLYKRTLASTVNNNAAVTTCPAASATSTCPADKELLHNVTLFSITYLDGQNQSVVPDSARSVELHVTVSKTLYNQPATADYTTRMVFRND